MKGSVHLDAAAAAAAQPDPLASRPSEAAPEERDPGRGAARGGAAPNPPAVALPSGRAAEILAAFEELRQEYLRELPECIASLVQSFARVREAPGDTAAIQALRSKAHALHGTAGSHRFRSISAAAKRVEDVLDQVITGEASIGQVLTTLGDGLADVEAAFSAEQQSAAQSMPSLPKTR